jgi:hypothetical protein
MTIVEYFKSWFRTGGQVLIGRTLIVSLFKIFDAVKAI